MTEAAEPLSKHDLFEEIFTWSNRLTGEAAGVDDYVWPEAASSLFERLKHCSQTLVPLIGLQGVGKTSAAQAIARDLELYLKKRDHGEEDEDERAHVVLVRISAAGQLIDSLWNQNSEEIKKESYLPTLKEELRERIEKDPVFRRKVARILGVSISSSIKMNGDERKRINDDLKELDLEAAEAAFFKKGERMIMRDKAIADYLSMVHTLILDLPDYSKKDQRLINKDINDIQDLWKRTILDTDLLLAGGGTLNLVYTLQKETLGGHYFTGKGGIFEIRPFTAGELVDAYTKIWEKKFAQTGVDLRTWPFEEKALLCLARYSRGIFRRFLKYIGMCLGPLMSSPDLSEQPVDLKRVQSAVDWEEIQKDWESELSRIFKKEDTQRLAMKIIVALMKTGEVSQGNLAKALQVSEVAVSRILGPLEENGFIVRERRDQEKIVRANV
jgi:hypothetical protein